VWGERVKDEERSAGAGRDVLTVQGGRGAVARVRPCLRRSLGLGKQYGCGRRGAVVAEWSATSGGSGAVGEEWWRQSGRRGVLGEDWWWRRRGFFPNL
jgi:hypothetical protein